jgi:hypothetical protein
MSRTLLRARREEARLWSDGRTSSGRTRRSSLPPEAGSVFSSPKLHGCRLTEPCGPRCLPDNGGVSGARLDSDDGVEAQTQSDCDESNPMLEP